jgi:endonuclease YncB( thermonuclease family)
MSGQVIEWSYSELSPSVAFGKLLSYPFAMRRTAVLILITLSIVSIPAPAQAETILKITDGDTIRINTGEDVRLLQIDTPEPMSAECYAAEATQALTKLISGKTIRLESDPVSDNIDQYKRLLRYVFVGKLNVNLRMVEIGAAAPYFYQGEKGKYSKQLLKAAEKARANKVGLWGKCPNAKLDPSRSLSSGNSTQVATNPRTGTSSQCDPNYDPCIPVSAYDLDCPDIYNLGLSSIRVIGKDVHRLDRDRDGVACENKP